ncbi:MAG: radical SAM protein [Patescibacteria group bacterium]|jgi:radical SAM superfamily enzyme YgiQ (UPF0313 family)
MKIVLSTLPRDGAYRSWVTPLIIEPKEVKYLPLGLLSLASNIDAPKHSVTILDPFAERWTIEDTAARINAINADVVGFSAATRWSYSLFKLLPKIEAQWVVVGGPHITCHAEEVIAWGADAVFRGQLADMDFAQWLDSPRSGVIDCKTDISNIKFPDRELIDYKSYIFEGKVLFKSATRMSMFTSVGCPNACKFCSVQTKRVMTKAPAAVLVEMQYLKQLGAGSVHIFDDNFNVNRQHIAGVLDAMERDNWRTEWSMRGQVKADLSIVPRLKATGLKRIHVGIESLNNKTLSWMRKNHRHDDILDFCRAYYQAGIDILAYFIIGTPCDNMEYLKDLAYLVNELGIKTPYYNILFPEPDTPYYYELLKEGYPDYWADYFKHPIPYYDIPHPRGEEFRDMIIEYAEHLMKGVM